MSRIVNSVAYADGRRVAEVGLEQVREVLADPARWVWIGLHEPDEELLRRVQREFGLHDLAVEDAHRAHQRPKLERYGDSLFVVLRTAHVDRGAGPIRFGETHIFMGPRYVVSVRHGPSLSYAEVRSRCEALPALLGQGPAFALYALMDFVVDQYFPVVQALEEDLDDLEDDIFRRTFDRETTARIYRLKRDLVELKRAVSPLADVCNRLQGFEQPLIPEDTRPYFRDVYDHVIRINELVDSQRELATAVLEANLTMASVSQNEDLKRLAGWAAIIGVPTMLAGVWGMNFRHMPELDWPWGYPLALGGMLALCGLLYLRFKRAGWL